MGFEAENQPGVYRRWCYSLSVDIIEGKLLMGIEVAGLLGLIWLIIVIWAIIKTAQARVGPVPKILWILILLLFPLVGLILWFFLGPKG